MQRQVVLKDGCVVADTGPQVITRTLDESHTEAGDDEASHPKWSDGEELADPTIVRSVSRTRRTRRAASKEQRHYHDEERREVTDREELERGVSSPQDLLDQINNNFPDVIKGQLTFFSSKSKEVASQETVKEVSKLDSKGNIRTSTTLTRHQEEVAGDEVPESDVDVSYLPPWTQEPEPELLESVPSSDVFLHPITREPEPASAAHSGLPSALSSTRTRTRESLPSYQSFRG